MMPYPYVYMELSRKTTILFPPELHDRLTQLAKQRATSLGELVRRACELQYRVHPAKERLEAANALAELSLPVGPVEQMNEEAVPDAEDYLP